MVDLPSNRLKRANRLRHSVIAWEEEQRPSLRDQVEEHHRLTAAIDERPIGDAVTGLKSPGTAPQPAARLRPVIGIDREGGVTIVNSELRNRGQDAAAYRRYVDDRRDGPLPHGPHERILSQDQPGTQMGPPQHAPRDGITLSLVGVEQP